MFSSRFSDCSSAAIDFDASSDYFKVHLYPDPWGFKTGNDCINFIEKMFLYSSAMLILLVPSTIFFTLQTYRSFLKPYIQLRKHQDRNHKFCFRWRLVTISDVGDRVENCVTDISCVSPISRFYQFHDLFLSYESTKAKSK